MSAAAKASTGKKAQIGIRIKLIFGLVVFTLLVLVAIWVLQIRLLSYFYEREKFAELESAYDEIYLCVGDSDFKAQVQRAAEKHGVCVRVFEIIGGVAKEIGDAETGANCMIHHLPTTLLVSLYESAAQNGGSYDKRMEFNLLFSLFHIYSIKSQCKATGMVSGLQ